MPAPHPTNPVALGRPLVSCDSSTEGCGASDQIVSTKALLVTKARCAPVLRKPPPGTPIPFRVVCAGGLHPAKKETEAREGHQMSLEKQKEKKKRGGGEKYPNHASLFAFWNPDSRLSGARAARGVLECFSETKIAPRSVVLFALLCSPPACCCLLVSHLLHTRSSAQSRAG